MDKHRTTNERNLGRMFFPSSNDVLGIAVKMLGGDRSTGSFPLKIKSANW
ncbi:MAG: hypothetical protein LBC03_03790 [Nitrososphaerota archaeon]|jgi:hypothetical protein|nr:hypothetical protein [Nitrososphaerota archaeon]